MTKSKLNKIDENYKSYIKSKFIKEDIKEEFIHDLKPLYVKKIVIKEPELNEDKLSIMQFVSKYKVL